MTDNPAHTDALTDQLRDRQDRFTCGPAKPAPVGGCTAEFMALMRQRRRHSRSAWTPRKANG